MAESTIRILIADDHAIVRKGIRRMLEEQSDFKIVGEATDGKARSSSSSPSKPAVHSPVFATTSRIPNSARIAS